MIRTFARLSLALLLVLALPACGVGGEFDDLFSGGGTKSQTPPAGTPMTETEMVFALEVLDLVNAERLQADLPLVEWFDGSMQVGQDHNLNMRDQDFFDHVDPEGRDPGGRLAEADVRVTAWGENIARGQGSAQEVMTAWMNSPGHRENILYPSFTHLSVSVLNLPGGPWWTQVFHRE